MARVVQIQVAPRLERNGHSLASKTNDNRVPKYCNKLKATTVSANVRVFNEEAIPTVSILARARRYPQKIDEGINFHWGAHWATRTNTMCRPEQNRGVCKEKT